MEINYVDKKVSYADMLKYVEVVVQNSFGKKSGKYHTYLREYAQTVALVNLFTDYQIQSTKEEDLLNEMLEICHSRTWNDVIIPKIGDKYWVFEGWVNDEIDNLTKPFAQFDATVHEVKNMVAKINEILDSIDTEKLKNVDVDELTKALTMVYGKLDNSTNTASKEEITDKPKLEVVKE